MAFLAVLALVVSAAALLVPGGAVFAMFLFFPLFLLAFLPSWQDSRTAPSDSTARRWMPGGGETTRRW